MEAIAQNVENSTIGSVDEITLELGFHRLQFAFVEDTRNGKRVDERIMGHREVAEEHPRQHDHTTGHPSSHRAFSSSPPSHVVDRLVKLKDSDPEMFSEAWNRLPDSTRANILEYLKKYPNLLEKEYPLLLLHRSGSLSGYEVEEFEEQASTTPEAEALETVVPLQRKQPARRIRPKSARATAPPRSKLEPVNGEPVKSSPRIARNSRTTAEEGARGKADPQFLSEMRKILKQNSIQIELLQRLLQAYEDRKQN